MTSQHADLALAVYIPARATAAPTQDYYAVVRNNGSDRANDIAVRFNTRPTAVIVDRTRCQPDAHGCSIRTMAVGAEEQILLRVATDVREQEIVLEISVAGGVDDPDPTNNRRQGRTSIVLAPAIRLSIQGSTADPGQTVEYSALLTNASEIDAVNTTFTLPLPEGWSFERSLSSELTCSAEGNSARCTVARVRGRTTLPLGFVLRAAPSLAGSRYTTVRVPLTTDYGIFNDDSNSFVWMTTSAYRHLTVSTTVDEGAGSLRAALLLANGECLGFPSPPCKVVFDIAEAPAGDHYTIRPITSLPLITAQLLIDGSTQTRRRGDTNAGGPEIEINGSRLSSGAGIDIATPYFRMSDLVINGFPFDGVRVSTAGFSRVIERCYIGTDAAGRVAVPNGARGVSIDVQDRYGSTVALRDNIISGNRRSGVFVARGGGTSLTGNRIGLGAGPNPVPIGNGASGVYFGPSTQSGLVQSNVIAHNVDAGIAIDLQALWIAIRGNSIFDNGSLGIDYGLDLSTPNVTGFRELPNYPVITSARYDGGSGKTRIEGRIEVPYVPSVAEVELFANDSAPEGFSEGQLFLGRVTANASRQFALETDLDLRGRFITATFTGPNNYYPEILSLKTSEFSPAVQVAGDAATPFDPSQVLPRGADLALHVSGFSSFSETAAGSKSQVYVSVENFGPAAAEDATVDLTLSAGSWTVSYGPCSASGQRVHCAFGRIEPQAGAWATLFAQAPIATGTQALQGVLGSTTEDRNPANNSVSQQTSVTGKARLNVDIESPGSVDPGEVATWLVHVVHATSIAAGDITMTIPLPFGWVLVSGPSNEWQCRQEQSNVICRLARLEGLSQTDFEFSLRAPESRFGQPEEGRRIQVSAATGLLTEPYASAVFGMNRLLAVTTTADVIAGSLRDAIETANRVCRQGAPFCKIIFELDPALSRDGVFSIRPLVALPRITADNAMIDARTQTVYGGDTNPLGPEVELNGSQVPVGNGLELSSSGRSGVRGMAISGFPGNGVVIDQQAGSDYNRSRVIADNYIGTTATGQAALPNGSRGISVETGPDFRTGVDVLSNVISGNRRSGIFIAAGSDVHISGNRVGLTSGDAPAPLGNAASGIYLGNVIGAAVNANLIAFNRDAGLSTARAAQWNGLRHNSIFENGQLAVDLGLDSVTHNDDAGRPADLPQYPVLLAATWDDSAKVTRITGTVNVLQNESGLVELFTNKVPDGSGYGEAEQPIGELVLGPNDPAQFTFETPLDLRGDVITAMFSRGSSQHSTGWTSEVSPAIPVK
jgi:uncharacterized repeat protein (TIGR01451 family)